MFSKQFMTITHSKDLFFCVHSHAISSFPILSDAVTEIMELWEAELLESLILINMVPRISMVV